MIFSTSRYIASHGHRGASILYEVLQTIKELAEEGMICILVTHEMAFAREVADHSYFTDRGIIVEHGPPEAFFTNATDPRTKEFLSQIL